MKILNKEIIFRHIVANLAMFLFVALIFTVCLNEKNKDALATQNSEYNGTIYAGDKNSNKVSLMINVYWGTEYVETMLDILKEKNAKATFFVGGTWAKENVLLLKRIVSEGHEIGSHGTNHKEHGKISFQQNLTEIQTCHEIVRDLISVDMELFAPPGGSYNQNTIKACNMLGYKTIMWTRDTIDWRDHNTNLIKSRAVVNMSGGDLILMHPTANTVEAMGDIIDYATSHGFVLTTVSDTLGLK